MTTAGLKPLSKYQRAAAQIRIRTNQTLQLYVLNAVAGTIALSIEGLCLEASIAGRPDQPGLLLVHGWPHCRMLFDDVMNELGRDFFVIAPDLPEVGGSRGSPASAEKTVLADAVVTAAEAAGASMPIVVGLDVGGMIAFAAARDHGDRIAAAIVINTVIPGLDPWSELLADSRIWHFAFHSTPELPEKLVHGNERTYFDYFHDMLAADPQRIAPEKRAAFARAYARPEALKAGFDWYRAMSKDAEHNANAVSFSTPLLYVRGDADGRSVETYIKGLTAGGARNLKDHVVADAGELLPLETPEAFVALVRDYCRSIISARLTD